MNRLFEELDYRPTPIGTLSLRRRREAMLDKDVIEIKLGDEYLMSSLFTVSEIALSRLGLDALPGQELDVVVGGLGLGYTAKAVLDDDKVSSLLIIEFLDAIIDWHESGLLPLGPGLTGDPRCRIRNSDFFALAAREEGFDDARPGRTFDAILVDIDHTPDALLDERSSGFYRPEGLRAMSAHLKPGGIFGLWSDDRPDPEFTDRLASVFAETWAEPVTFHNPLLNQPYTQTVYLARTASGSTSSDRSG